MFFFEIWSVQRSQRDAYFMKRENEENLFNVLSCNLRSDYEENFCQQFFAKNIQI